MTEQLNSAISCLDKFHNILYMVEIIQYIILIIFLIIFVYGLFRGYSIRKIVNDTILKHFFPKNKSKFMVIWVFWISFITVPLLEISVPSSDIAYTLYFDYYLNMKKDHNRDIKLKYFIDGCKYYVSHN